MENEKIYVGSGIEKFDGGLVQATICLTDITKNASEHVFEYEGKKYLKIKVQRKKNGADQYGKTHYVEVDTWKPEAKKSEPAKQEDDLPF